MSRRSGSYRDTQFSELMEQLSPRDLLVANNTQVIKARLVAHKSTGAKIEILIERIVSRTEVLASLRSNKTLHSGQRMFVGSCEIEVIGRNDSFYRLSFFEEVGEVLALHGQVPLPPYIKREANESDESRYQTVYASVPGAIAAPTAGLHFDQVLMSALAQSGIDVMFITLHVGAGTFQPVRSETIEFHKMHKEYLEVSRGICEAVARTQARGGRVIAVGTTTVRALETAALDGALSPYAGESDLFIYPGFEFRIVDALITNFHLPRSTLLMLVCAFAGRKGTLQAYEHAIDHGYRFFSYGDAMFITDTIR